MAANDREETAASVQASKLSPLVKPFVPRHLQQTECYPRLSYSPHPPHSASARYNPNYQINHGYHDHQAHYFPFMTGPYSLQDFQTGYSLYPYPVFMVEDVTPHGSYVSPGTFVCPRASLQPQRSRTSPKSRFNREDRGSTMTTKEGNVSEDGARIQSFSNKNGSVTSSETSEEVDPIRNGRITNGETTSMDERDDVSNDEKPNCNGLKVNDRQTNWKQRKSRQIEKETTTNEGEDEEKVAKTSNLNSRSSRDQIKRETHFPKPKSFAEIIKQNSCDGVVVDGRRNSDTVPIRTTKDEEKSKRVMPTANGDQRFVSKPHENGTRAMGGNDGQRWSFVQSKRNHYSDHNSRNRSSRRSSTSSDANSVHYEKPVQKNSFTQNCKDYEVSKKSTSKNNEDSIRTNESKETEVTIDVADNDTWTEVKSNRRWKEPKQQSRKQVHFSKKNVEDKVVETLNHASEDSSPPSSQETEKKPSPNRLESFETKTPTLCNSKTLKNTENQLEKSRSESRAANSESLGNSEDHNDVKTKKKKRKTAGQLKKEFQNKVKTLPAVQGKVLTVTEEFYNQFKQNTTDNSTVNNVLKEKLLSANEFPILGKRNQSVEDIAFTMNLLNVNSDDSWSDVEGNETSERSDKKKNFSNVDTFPALGSLIEPFITADTSYSSLLKKNFWSLPPRITPVENVATDNRTSFLEKLLAESSLKDCSAICEQTNRVGGLIAIPESSSNNGTDRVPIKKVEPRKKPKANSLVQIYLMNILKKKHKCSKMKHTRNHLSSKYAKRNMRKVRPFIANILDSTAPLRRRGKEREFPRKKKPSALKKVILKEREEKRSIRLSQIVACESEKENEEEEAVEDEAKDQSCALPSVSCSEDVTAKHLIHSRKFREYCDQMLNPEIDEVAKNLIHDLIRIHDRLYNKNPIKASMRRRMVIGLREVGKHLKQKKLKCLILAPNLERIKSSGGLDEAMYSVIGMAQEQNVPFVFALGRRRLGRVCLKKVPVSCVGIFNYGGSETNFNRLCELAEEARKAYQNTLCETINGFELNDDGIADDVDAM